MQSIVSFKGYDPAMGRSGQYAQYHFNRSEVAAIVKDWNKIAHWTTVDAKENNSDKSRFHNTTIARRVVNAPIRDYIDNYPARKWLTVLYHGMGRDEVSLEALRKSRGTATGYDPFHPDATHRSLPSGTYDEIHSHYTLNVVSKSTGLDIMREILGTMGASSRAIVTVRRDL